MALFRIVIDEYSGEAGARYAELDPAEARAASDLLDDWRVPVTDYIEPIELTEASDLLDELREGRENAAGRRSAFADR